MVSLFQVTARAQQGCIFWSPVAAEVLPGRVGWSSMPSLRNDVHIHAAQYRFAALAWYQVLSSIGVEAEHALLLSYEG